MPHVPPGPSMPGRNHHGLHAYKHTKEKQMNQC